MQEPPAAAAQSSTVRASNQVQKTTCPVLSLACSLGPTRLCTAPVCEPPPCVRPTPPSVRTPCTTCYALALPHAPLLTQLTTSPHAPLRRVPALLHALTHSFFDVLIYLLSGSCWKGADTLHLSTWGRKSLYGAIFPVAFVSPNGKKN